MKIKTIFLVLLSPVLAFGSVDFNGNRIAMGTDSQLNVALFSPQTFTLSLWLKWSFAAGSFALPICRTTGVGTNGYDIILHESGVNGKVSYRRNSTAIVDASGTWNDGIWHNIVVTGNGSSIEIFIDGVSRGTGSPGFPSSNTSAPFTLWGRNGTSSSPAGTMDDVRVYNRVLSQNEIESLYGSRSRLLILDGIVGWWKLDDGVEGGTISGATVRDSSGNVLTGTASGSPTWGASNEINYP